MTQEKQDLTLCGSPVSIEKYLTEIGYQLTLALSFMLSSKCSYGLGGHLLALCGNEETVWGMEKIHENILKYGSGSRPYFASY